MTFDQSLIILKKFYVDKIYYKSKLLNTKSTIGLRKLSKYLILFIHVLLVKKLFTTLYIYIKIENSNNIE